MDQVSSERDYTDSFLKSMREAAVQDVASVMPFEWGECWRFAVDYDVDDFAAELGFASYVLGLTVVAHETGYALLNSCDGHLTLAIREARTTKPGRRNFRLCLMVSDLRATITTLRARGASIHLASEPSASRLGCAIVKMPSGVQIEIWGPG